MINAVMKVALLFVGLLTLVFGTSVRRSRGNDSQFGQYRQIIGGNIVGVSDRPYTVRLRLRKDLNIVAYCGGARLNRYWFITAAECLENDEYDTLQLLYPKGLISRGHYERKEFDFIYMKYAIHPKYDERTKANNLALIWCEYCTGVDPMSLPLLPKNSEKSETFSRSSATVSGWRVNTTASNPLDAFQIASFDTSIVCPFFCKLLYFFSWITNEHICASSWGGKRLSQDNTGVPLVTTEGQDEDTRFKLIGIAASIRPWTNKIPVPTVFIRIAPHIEWISEETGIDLRI